MAGFSLVGTMLALVVSLVAGGRGFARLTGEHPGAVLASLTALRIAGVVVFALGAPLWVALSGLWARTAAIALAEPVEATWVNAHADGATRATVLSTNSQLDAIGQVVGGPPLGALGRSAGVPVALLAAAALLVPAAVIQLRLRDAGSGGGGGPHVRPGALAAGCRRSRSTGRSRCCPTREGQRFRAARRAATRASCCRDDTSPTTTAATARTASRPPSSRASCSVVPQIPSASGSSAPMRMIHR